MNRIVAEGMRVYDLIKLLNEGEKITITKGENIVRLEVGRYSKPYAHDYTHDLELERIDSAKYDILMVAIVNMLDKLNTPTD